MDMCYEGTLVMPSSYAVMNEEEMTYVEGGAPETVTLRFNPIMRSKTGCRAIALKTQIQYGYWGISTESLAAEIYAHAYIFYSYRRCLNVAVGLGMGGVFASLHESISDGIQLQNKLDDARECGVPRYLFYQALYTVGPAYIPI